MPRTKVPDYVLHNLKLQTTREFKALKRQQLRLVIRALDELRMGCAYAPGHSRVEQMAQLLDEWKRDLSEKEWGR